MKLAVHPQGYTMVEVMIFLAVSGGLLAITAFFISGQQARTEFTQAVRDAESQVQDVINDVTTGYYDNTNNYQCSASAPGRPSITAAASNQQGANTGCLFIGRVIHFAVHSTNEEGFNVYTVVGRQQVTVGSLQREVQNLDDAVPTAVARSTVPGTTAIPLDTFDAKRFQSGVQVKWVRSTHNGVTTNVGAIGFFSTFGKYASSGANLISGAQVVELVPVPGSSLNQTSEAAAAAVDTMTVASTTPIKNPSDGVTVCLQSSTSNQHAELTIGGSKRQSSTKLAILAGGC